MSRDQKRLQKFASAKQRPKYEVEAVLDRYFSGNWKYAGRGSSHIIVCHKQLAGAEEFTLPGYEETGAFNIAVKSGSYVKGPYLRKILRAIQKIEEQQK